MAPEYSRERFLLKLLGAVYALQLLSFGLGVVVCAYVGVRREQPVCPDLPRNFQTMFDTATTTVLALLGGSALRKD